MHPVEAERFQQVEMEVGEVGDLVEPGRIVRLAETGMLRRETAKRSANSSRNAIQPVCPPAPCRKTTGALPRGRLGTAAEQPDRRAGDRYRLDTIRHLRRQSRVRPTCRKVRLRQTSDRAATSASISASLCSGVGVRRSRSVPRGTVG